MLRGLRGFWRFIAPVLGVAALCVATSSLARPPEDDPFNWTLDHWIQWRDQEIARLLVPTSLPNGDQVIVRQTLSDRAMEPFAVISKCQQRDATFFSEKSQRGKELSHFVDFVVAQHWMALSDPDGKHPNAMGLEVSDRNYLEYAAKNLVLPPLLKSQDFLREISDPATYKAAVDRIETNNANLPPDRKWIVLPFLSQFIKSVDETTFARILIMIPNEPNPSGGVTDRWVQFAIQEPGAVPPSEVKSVSMITVNRESKDSPASQTSMMDFFRIRAGEILVMPTPFFHENKGDNCYDCHKTAVIPIKPEFEYEFDATGGLARKTSGAGRIPAVLNERLAEYGQVNLGVQSPYAYGPSLGPAERLRSAEFIREASGIPLSDASVDRIRSNMRCSSCHDSVGRLNYPMAVHSGRDIGAFKTGVGLVQSYIEKGFMPPGNSLSAKERHALYLCLTKEYYDPPNQTGVLVEWLKGRGG